MAAESLYGPREAFDCGGAGSDDAEAVAEARALLGTEHPDLAAERARAAFNVRLMTHVIDGGAEATATRERVQGIIASDPVLGDTESQVFRGRTQRFKDAWAKVARVDALRALHRMSEAESNLLTYNVHNTDPLPSVLNDYVFLPCLLSQASDEQLKTLLPLAKSHRMFGCFAQTELGHGSNVQGLETTATFMPETDEFELHSPTLSATKWWIGGLGRTATHAVVMAQLIIKGKGYGVHPFLCQLRDMDTHKLRDGIAAGDIGPKLGFTTVDNGFMRLNRVRIPRSQMLTRNSQVLADGSYVKPKHPKAAYGGMVAVRIGMVQDAGTQLARGLTIAVRYSAVRRQFGAPKADGAAPAGKETAVLDYMTQQHKLMPLLATAYAFRFTRSFMEASAASLKERVAAGETKAATSLHLLSSGLKSLVTSLTADGLEVCRRCCGGHGFSRFTGLSDWWATYVHVCTAEGENTVLTQQTARFLVRVFGGHAKGAEKDPLVAYLADGAAVVNEAGACTATSMEDMLRGDVQLAALRARAAAVVARTAAVLVETTDAATATGMQADHVAAAAWNSALVEMETASHAHCTTVVAAAFADGVDQVVAKGVSAVAPGASADGEESSAIATALAQLRSLFALTHVERGMGDLVASGHMTREQGDMVRAAIRHLCAVVRVHAVPLVDAWGMPDFLLGSALGRYDGQAYAKLFLMVHEEPLNRPGEADSPDMVPLNRSRGGGAASGRAKL